MSEPENLVLQQLREIRAVQDRQEDHLSVILTRLTGIERLIVLLYGMQTDGELRMKRLEERVERLEALGK